MTLFNEPLCPEEEMMIEQQALEAFLFAAEYGGAGIDHLLSEIEGLKKRLEDYENQ